MLPGASVFRPAVYLLLTRDEEHVPSPASGLRPLRVVHLGTIAEAVAVGVRPFRLLVVEMKARHGQRRKGRKLFGLRDAVVVHVLPETQVGEGGVARVYHSVAVPAPRRVVKGREGVETVRGVVRRRLWGGVAEQSPSAVDCPVPVAVEGEPRVVGAGGRP